jgi:hypothetical protein
MSNFALGRLFRTFVVAVVGYVLAVAILPQTGIVHTPNDLKAGSFVVAVVLGMIAYRHT